MAIGTTEESPKLKRVARKKHFLVIWPTIRKDWVSTFYRLEDQFRFTFIPSTFPQEPNFADRFECRYWSEFQSIPEVLDKLHPDGIIFMSIESGLSIATNYLAQKRGIQTIVLQHGIFTNYRDYRVREKLWRKESRAKEARSGQQAKGFSSLKFLKASLSGIDRIHLFSIALFTKIQQKYGPYWAAKHLPLKIKRADRYLCYSPFNATIHRETDRITEGDIRYIGSPELMTYLEPESDLINEPFYLHIDQALAENSFGEETVSKDQVTQFYLRLNDFCLRQKSKLYIKLHPESYNSNWLPENQNIVYLKHCNNFNQVIQSAKGCFGFYSTMIIPAIYWKPTVLFRIQYSALQEEIKKLGNTQILDFWDFDSTEFEFRVIENRERIKKHFILPEGVNENSLAEILSE